MDDIVKAAMLKWPQVPNCHGWLALGARGQWFMRDDRIQAAGPFPRVLGSRIEHTKLLEFIHRNYACDAAGAWYFQNGPQRVYVDLEVTPYVWRIAMADSGWAVTAHTGTAAQVTDAFVDENGRLFLNSDLGLGLVHSLDSGLAVQALEARAWPVSAIDQLRTVPAAELPQRFGFVLSPRPSA